MKKKKIFTSLLGIGLMSIALASCTGKQKKTGDHSEPTDITNTGDSTTNIEIDEFTYSDTTLFSDSLVRVNVLDKKIETIEFMGTYYEVLFPVYNGDKISYLKSFSKNNGSLYKEIDLGFIYNQSVSYFYDESGNFNIVQINPNNSNYSAGINNGGSYNKLSFDKDSKITKTLTTKQDLSSSWKYDISATSITISKRDYANFYKYEYKITSPLKGEISYATGENESDIEYKDTLSYDGINLIIETEEKQNSIEMKKALKGYSDTSKYTISLVLDDLKPSKIIAHYEYGTDEAGTYTYTDSKRLKTVALPHFTASYEYDSNNKIISRNESGYYGKNESYTYDQKGINTHIDEHVSTSLIYTTDITYNANYLPSVVIQVNGHGKQSYETEYDSLNRVKSSKNYYFKTPSSDEKTLMYSYENTYTDFGVATSISYRYDDSGNIVSGSKIEYEYDTKGDVKKSSSSNLSSGQFLLTYQMEREFKDNTYTYQSTYFNNGFIGSREIQYTYYDKDFNTLGKKYINYSYQANNLISVTMREYDSNNNLKEMVSEKYNGSDNFISRQTVEYIYNEDSSETYVYYETKEVSKALIEKTITVGNESVTTEYYQASPNTVKAITTRKMIDDSYKEIKKETFEYDSTYTNIITATTKYTEYDENAEVIASKENEITYSESGNVSQDVTTYKNSNDDNYHVITLRYGYNSDNKLLLMTETDELYHYQNGEMARTVTNLKYSYTYEANKTIENITKHNSKTDSYDVYKKNTYNYDKGMLNSIERMVVPEGKTSLGMYLIEWYEYNDDGTIKNIEYDYFTPVSTLISSYAYDEDGILIKEEISNPKDSSYKKTINYHENSKYELEEYEVKGDSITTVYNNTYKYKMFLGEYILYEYTLEETVKTYEDSIQTFETITSKTYKLEDYCYMLYSIDEKGESYVIFDGGFYTAGTITAKYDSMFHHLISKEEKYMDEHGNYVSKKTFSATYNDIGKITNRITHEEKYDDNGHLYQNIDSEEIFTYNQDGTSEYDRMLKVTDEGNNNISTQIIYYKYDINGDVTEGTKEEINEAGDPTYYIYNTSTGEFDEITD